MTDDRRPRPSSGVMGYVARYQQLDPDPGQYWTPPSELSPDPADPYDTAQFYADQYEPRPEYPGSYPYEAFPDPDATAVFAAPDGRLIDLSAPRPAPVEHRRPDRVRKGVLALTALAVTAAGGARYVLLRGTASDNPAAAAARPSTDAPVSPATAPGDSVVPNGEPARTASPRPSATTTSITVVPVPATAKPRKTVAPVKSRAASPTSAPAALAPTSASPSASASAAPLAATYTYGIDGGDPITGYVGTIRVTNPGTTAAESWTVQLSAPSATTVTMESGDVTASLDGGRLTFHPSSDTIAAHGSSTFTFTLSDPLDALPTTCIINATPCT